MTASTAAAPRIFISYRRNEAAGHAGRLSDRLIKRFGRAQIFQDIDSIQPGDDFAEAIADAVASCHVLLALIGDRWLKIKDREGRRLDNPKDFVRLEIEAALSRNIRVIPILIDGATMPRDGQLPASLAGLAGRQALELSSNRFDSDVAHLLKALDRYLSELQNARPLAAMQGQPISTPPASPEPRSPTPDEMMASLSPAECAELEKIKDPEQRARQLLQLHMQKQALLATTQMNMAQMRRDMRKAVAQNLRA
jgi:hypothetical protein